MSGGRGRVKEKRAAPGDWVWRVMKMRTAQTFRSQLRMTPGGYTNALTALMNAVGCVLFLSFSRTLIYMCMPSFFFLFRSRVLSLSLSIPRKNDGNFLQSLRDLSSDRYWRRSGDSYSQTGVHTSFILFYELAWAQDAPHCVLIPPELAAFLLPIYLLA